MSAPSREEIEQQVQEDLMRLDAYRNQLSQMIQQHQVLAASRADHLRAREALHGLEAASDDSEVLVPLGGEAYIRGQPDRTGPVFLGIGSGYVAELERPRASELLAERTKQIEQAARDLEGQILQVEERMTILRRRVESMESRSAAEPTHGDVGRH
ncbi:MAG: prefoldin subunit alpha [Thermoplasmata archaeon]